MEEQATALVGVLRKASVPADTKLAQFNNLKSGIKHQRVPETAVPAIFDAIKVAISTQASSALVATSLSTTGHLLKRLSLQGQDALVASHASRLLPTLIERLGDQREAHRTAASQILGELWRFSDKEVERAVRDTALVGTNARAKEAGMLWVASMHKSGGLQFRGFVPNLVSNLEDPDGAVRETAKGVVVDLFRDAPEHAKADLKKQLQKYSVRSSIASFVISHLGIPGAVPEPDLKASAASSATTATTATTASDYLQPDTGFADSIVSEVPSQLDTAQMEPLFVHSQRDLEEIFRDMQPHFEGKENEQNWMSRDKNVLKLRRLTKGNAPVDYHNPFMAGIKGLLDGILKVANTLRTTMSSNGCQLVQELARTLGPAIDGMVEILLQNFIKMSAATKHIAAQNGNATVDIICSHVSYNARLLQHIWAACQDKNVQPRTYASGWLQTIIKKHSPHKSHFEHTGGAELAEKCVRKGLSDGSPKVKEGMRGAYWVFASVWPDRAESIMSSLDARAKLALERDPANPNAPAASSQGSVSNLSKSVGPGTARPSLRETIAAQRRAQMGKMPDRPSSAQSTFSPIKHASTSNLRERAAVGRQTPGSRPAAVTAPGPSGASKSTASAAPGGSNSLMAAPMRRPPRRPELARPATADPYASRRLPGRANTPTISPTITPQRDTTSKKSVASKSAVGPRTGLNGPTSPSVSPSKTKMRTDPRRNMKTPSSESPRFAGSPASPSRVAEEMTMVIPFTRPPMDDLPVLTHRRRMDKTMSVDSGIPMAQGGLEDDGFTMVVPDLRATSQQARDPTSRISPTKSFSERLNLASASPRSPRLKSPDRTVRGSETPRSAVKVYEDPSAGDDEAATPVTAPPNEKPVLEELPINETQPEVRQNHPAERSPEIQMSGMASPLPHPESETPPRSQRKQLTPPTTPNTDATPDRADVLRSRRLLASGLERVRARTLDAHGFRRLQEVVRANLDIWGPDGEKFPELLTALLQYLESPPPPAATGADKSTSLRTQALATAKAMLRPRRPANEPLIARALVAFVRARAAWAAAAVGVPGGDAVGYLVGDLERAADELAREAAACGRRGECVDAVAGALEDACGEGAGEAEEAVGGRAQGLTLGLAVLARLLRASVPAKAEREGKAPAAGAVVSPEQTERLGKLAVRCLGDSSPDVRRAVLEACLALYDAVGSEGGGEKEKGKGKEEFWRAMTGAREQSLNLVAYYVHRQRG